MRISTWSKLPANSVLILEGDPGNSFFILAAGEVKVIKGKKLLNTLKAGDSFGEMGYINRQATTRTASVVSHTDVTMVKIDAAALDKASENCQLDFNKAFLRTLVERLSSASAQLSKLIS